MRFLSLFSGMGGMDLGLEMAGMECAGQVEINRNCLEVLEKLWPHVKRITDVKKVKGDEFGSVDLIAAGVPCQPASTAGKRRGTQDERWLWGEAIRVIRQSRPTWLILENVGGLSSLEEGLALETILVHLEEIGYSVQPIAIPACAVGARHRRNRVWILAHAKHDGLDGSQESEGSQSRAGAQERSGRTQQPEGSGCGQMRAEDVAGSDSGSESPDMQGSWAQSGVGGMVDGLPNWMDEPALERFTERTKESTKRLKMLGNAVVPQVVAAIGQMIMAVERGEQAAPVSVTTNLFEEMERSR